jgi:hypothetical protein
MVNEDSSDARNGSAHETSSGPRGHTAIRASLAPSEGAASTYSNSRPASAPAAAPRNGRLEPSKRLLPAAA